MTTIQTKHLPCVSYSPQLEFLTLADVYRVVECRPAVIHPQGFLIDSSNHAHCLGKWYNERAAGQITGQRYPPMRRLEGTVISLLQIYNEAFQHIAFDTLPKWIAVRELLDNNPSARFLVTGKLQADMCSAFWKVPSSRFVIARKKEWFRVPHGIYVAFGRDDGRGTPMGSAGQGTISSLLVTPEAKPRSLVYMSRQGMKARSLETDDDVWLVQECQRAADRMGLALVHMVNPRDSRVSSQLRNARVVIGVHGGGLSNIIYCPADNHLIEIIPTAALRQRSCFYSLANALGQAYSFIEPTVFDFNTGKVRLDREAFVEKISAF
jgi:capsular polysaccharide biosynthesis protein